MKLVAGLGNPGEKYRGTRHNVGFEVVDLLARAARAARSSRRRPRRVQARWRRDGDVVLLVKPLTFMNLSGEAVAALAALLQGRRRRPAGRLRRREPAAGPVARAGERDPKAATTGCDRWPTRSARSTIARLRVGVGRGDAGATWPTTCWPGSSRTNSPGLKARLPGPPTPSRRGSTDGLATMMNMFNRAEATT